MKIFKIHCFHNLFITVKYIQKFQKFKIIYFQLRNMLRPIIDILYLQD